MPIGPASINNSSPALPVPGACILNDGDILSLGRQNKIILLTLWKVQLQSKISELRLTINRYCLLHCPLPLRYSYPRSICLPTVFSWVNLDLKHWAMPALPVFSI